MGAQPSETVRSILKREGAYKGLPTPKRSSRAGRKKVTARGTRRKAASDDRRVAKEARHTERVARRRAAKQAAAEASAES